MSTALTARRAAAWLALSLTAAALGPGCAATSSPPTGWVEASARDHLAADEAVGRGQLEQAEAALRAVYEREVPAGVAAEDASVVRRDASDRLARLALQRGALDDAERWAEAGLRLGAPDDVFTANLLTTRGRVREARGRDREAAADYHRALTIEEALLDAALGGGRDVP